MAKSKFDAAEELESLQKGKTNKPSGCWGQRIKEVDPEVERRKLEEEQTRAAMQEMFNAHDSDGSGVIDKEEMAELLKALGFGLGDEQIEGVLEEMRFTSGDRDEFDFDGFMNIIGTQNSVKDLEMKEMWPMFDRDGDGMLERHEVKGALSQCGIVIESGDFERLWLAADANNSGSIAYDEFVTASGDEVWKKAVAMMAIKKDFAGRAMTIAEQQKEWIELLEEREDAEFLVCRAKVMRRCALRESPQVKDAIWQLWTVLDGLRSGSDGCVGKELFQTYFMKIGKAVLKDDFDKDEMWDIAEEEWERQISRSGDKKKQGAMKAQKAQTKAAARVDAAKEALEAAVLTADVKLMTTTQQALKAAEADHEEASNALSGFDDAFTTVELESQGVDYGVFYESMFELLDYEVSRRGEEFIEASSYAGFILGIINQLVVEKISNSTKKWQKGQPTTEREKLGRNYVWLNPDEFNYTGKTGIWESIDRQLEAEVIAREEGQMLAEERIKKAKQSMSAPACAAKKSMRAVGGNPEKLFNRIDTDTSGALEYGEIQLHLSDEGLDDGTIEMLIMAMDADGDGVITRKEFIKGYGNYNDSIMKQLNRDRYGGTLRTVSPAQGAQTKAVKPKGSSKKANVVQIGL